MEKVVKEEWKDVPGYDGVYQISIGTKEGMCRRLYKNGKKLVLSNRPQKKEKRIYWNLSKKGKQVSYQAAKWIALTFPELIENKYFEGAVIDHKNCDSMDNRPSNLHWVTQRENCNNPLSRRHKSEALMGKLLNRPDLSKMVCQYTLDGVLIGVYPSTRQAAREVGLDRRSISQCCNGRIKTTGGYIWRHKEKEA